MAWIFVVVAGLFEVGWAISLKRTEGWTKLWPSVLTIALMIVSFTLLARGMRDLPAGTAYAVWTGIGTVGVALLGVLFFGEPATWPRLACIGLIVTGIVGLKLMSR